MFSSFRLTRAITRSVDDLYRGTLQVAEGDFSHQIPVRGEHQLSELATSFNSMTAKIRQMIGEVVVSAKLSARAALAASGALPENVNYAVKSSFLLSFLESVPEVSAKLKEPNTKERKFEDVVKSAEQAAVLVLVY